MNQRARASRDSIPSVASGRQKGPMPLKRHRTGYMHTGLRRSSRTRLVLATEEDPAPRHPEQRGVVMWGRSLNPKAFKGEVARMRAHADSVVVDATYEMESILSRLCTGAGQGLPDSALRQARRKNTGSTPRGRAASRSRRRPCQGRFSRGFAASVVHGVSQEKKSSTRLRSQGRGPKTPPSSARGHAHLAHRSPHPREERAHSSSFSPEQPADARQRVFMAAAWS